MNKLEQWRKFEVRERNTNKLVECLAKEDWAEEYGADFEFDEIEYKRFTWTHIYYDTKYPVIDDLLDAEEAKLFLDHVQDLVNEYSGTLYLLYLK